MSYFNHVWCTHRNHYFLSISRSRTAGCASVSDGSQKALMCGIFLFATGICSPPLLTQHRQYHLRSLYKGIQLYEMLRSSRSNVLEIQIEVRARCGAYAVLRTGSHSNADNVIPGTCSVTQRSSTSVLRRPGLLFKNLSPHHLTSLRAKCTEPKTLRMHPLPHTPRLDKALNHCRAPNPSRLTAKVPALIHTC